MNKNVYLFELDSVRNSNEEISIAQRALFDELIHHGNRVIMTFNQIADSVSFLCALENEDTRKQIVSLFDRGYLQISQFSYIRDGQKVTISTPVQYFLNSLDHCIAKNDLTRYRFSSLESFNFTIEDYVILRDALKYCDTPSLLALSKEAVGDSDEQIAYHQRKWSYMYNWISLIIDISQSASALHPPKEGTKHPFSDFMNQVIHFGAKELEPRLKQLGISQHIPTKILEVLLKDTDYSQNRSDWLNALLQLQLPKEQEQFTELIIDLCYNYANEDSIAYISKHYTELGDESFWNDFAYRLSIYNQRVQDNLHFTCRYSPVHHWLSSPIHITYWDTLERMLQTNATPSIHSYFIEGSYREDMNQMTAWRKKYYVKKLLSLVVFISLFIVVELLVNVIQEQFDVHANVWLGTLVTAFISAGLFAAAGAFFENALHLPDILESFQSLYYTFKDMHRIWSERADFAYHCPMNEGTPKSM